MKKFEGKDPEVNFILPRFRRVLRRSLWQNAQAMNKDLCP